MNMKFTHTGIIEGCDSRTKPDSKYTVNLRETKNFWVTVGSKGVGDGTKYRKHDGWGVGDFPMYSLDIKTISPIIAA